MLPLKFVPTVSLDYFSFLFQFKTARYHKTNPCLAAEQRVMQFSYISSLVTKLVSCYLFSSHSLCLKIICVFLIEATQKSISLTEAASLRDIYAELGTAKVLNCHIKKHSMTKVFYFDGS